MPGRVGATERPGRGLAFAVAAYGLWGALPLYFVLLAPAGPFEIVGFRILLSLAFCLLLITVTRGWRRFRALLNDRRAVLLMGVAAAFIFVNWQVYVLAALSGHIVEGSLGYFINPLVTVLLGVLVLRERLRPAQWAALGVSVAAIVVLAVGYGAVPWISLVLAFSFGLYGFVKKTAGPRVDAIGGLTLETAWAAPLAVTELVAVAAVSGLVFGTAGAGHTALMLAAGAATATPLLLFAAAARRLSLVLLGLTQYIAPAMQLVVGVVVLGEPMPLERWIGFALVWVALAVLTVDMVVAARGPRRASLEPR